MQNKVRPPKKIPERIYEHILLICLIFFLFGTVLDGGILLRFYAMAYPVSMLLAFLLRRWLGRSHWEMVGILLSLLSLPIVGLILG